MRSLNHIIFLPKLKKYQKKSSLKTPASGALARMWYQALYVEQEPGMSMAT